MTPATHHDVLPSAYKLQRGLQIVAATMIALIAASLFIASALAAAGVLPWVELPLRIGEMEPDWAGRMAQIAATIFALLLCAFLPPVFRVMRLEAAHRDFGLRMDDVARAYWIAHAADRTGTFQMSREFDAVRERILFLRNHPDLERLDGEVLELAAQMSHESAELAEMFSDEKVARARETLKRREEDATELDRRISEANAITGELRRWVERVEFDEDVARSQIERLRAELSELLPQIDPPSGGKGRLRVAAGI